MVNSFQLRKIFWNLLKLIIFQYLVTQKYLECQIYILYYQYYLLSKLGGYFSRDVEIEKMVAKFNDSYPNSNITSKNYKNFKRYKNFRPT